jgi:hypothetical protein
MLENPVVSNSTRKSENLFGADNQQERLVSCEKGIVQMKKRKKPLKKVSVRRKSMKWASAPIRPKVWDKFSSSNALD